MCHSEAVSWSTFALGWLSTTAALLVIALQGASTSDAEKGGAYTVFAMGYFISLMQMAEALSWRSVKKGGEPWEKLVTFVLLTQPLFGEFVAIIMSSTVAGFASGSPGFILYFSVTAWLLLLTIVGLVYIVRNHVPLTVSVRQCTPAKLHWKVLDNRYINAAYTFAIISTPWTLWAFSVPLAVSTFAQVVGPWIGSYIISRETSPSLYCWGSLFFGPLSGLVVLVSGAGMQALYISCAFVFSVLFVPYRVFRLLSPQSYREDQAECKGQGFPSLKNSKT
jgi:hypothetical protein